MTKFYDGSELLSRSKHNIFFSFGGRYIGKSTFWQRYIIRHFLKKKEKFGIIVKFKDDLKTFCKNYFSQDWMDKWYPDFEIKYEKEKYYIRLKTAKKDIDDDKTGWVQGGYAIALAQNATIKSTTIYQDIDNILFEEVIPLDDRYIKNAKDPNIEVKLLISVYQSIARGLKNKQTRNVKLICISNNYTLNNQYFNYLKILEMVSKNKNSVFQRFYEMNEKKLKYVVEFSQLKPGEAGIEKDDENSGLIFSDFRNELKITKDRPKNIIIQLTFDNKYYISIAKYNDSIIAYHDKLTIKLNDICVYSCNKIKNLNIMGIKLFKNSDIYKIITNLYESNQIYYDKLETFINLTNILAF